MKKGTVKVGCKIGTERFQVECSIDIPENAADRVKLSKGSDDFQNAMFERGWRIWNQEQSGARDFVTAASVKDRESKDFPAKVQAIIDAADPAAPPHRTGRPAKPREVTMTPELTKAMKSGDATKFAELLAAQGIKVNIQ